MYMPTYSRGLKASRKLSNKKTNLSLKIELRKEGLLSHAASAETTVSIASSHAIAIVCRDVTNCLRYDCHYVICVTYENQCKLPKQVCTFNI